MNKVKFVAKGNTDLIEKFINYLMHQGKKTVARAVLNDCFAIIEKKTGKKGKEIFSEALENVKPSLEVRAKRIGGSVYLFFANFLLGVKLTDTQCGFKVFSKSE